MNAGLGFQIERLSDDAHPGQNFGTRDGRHVFWFEQAPNGGQRLWLDGERFEPFDELVVPSAGIRTPTSLGEGRFAYVLRRGADTYVGADRDEYGPYSKVAMGCPGEPARPGFSPGDRHLVFYAVVDDQSLLVLDGTPIEPIAPAGEAASYTKEMLARVGYGSKGVTFSSDGSRMAHVLADETPHGSGEWIVIDGVGSPRYDGVADVSFSPDGRRVAYGATREGLWRLVVDGVDEPAFDGLAGCVFSPDGDRIAYVASDARHHDFVVVDGERQSPADGIADLRFSPDGHRLAYLAGQGKRFVAVVDGVAGPAWDQVFGGLSFSPDGRHLAYLAQEAAGGFLSRKRTVRAVVDGTPGPTFDAVSSAVRWSPDSDHWAFVAARGKDSFVVVDDEPGPPFEKIFGMPYWSATGRLAYLAVREHAQSVIADGVAGPDLEGLSADTLTGNLLWFSPDGEHLVYLGSVGGSLRAIVDGQLGPAMQGIDNPVFESGRVSFLGLIDDKPVRISKALND